MICSRGAPTARAFSNKRAAKLHTLPVCSCTTRSTSRLTAIAGNLRNGRQRLHRGRLIAHAEHRVRIHREIDVRMPRQELSRLRRDAGSG
jgi:hypothetical protein